MSLDPIEAGLMEQIVQQAKDVGFGRLLVTFVVRQGIIERMESVAYPSFTREDIRRELEERRRGGVL